MDVKTHYDLLIEEGNDPVYDPPALKAYMDRWDGPAFIEALRLTPQKSVLEIGIGTGRLAIRTALRCDRLTGIDISPRTIERANENLAAFSNVRLICADFSEYVFEETFDIVYSSLTSMHFKDKQRFVSKAASLLKQGGILCISIDRNPSAIIDMGNRTLEIAPDQPDIIAACIKRADLQIISRFETEAAHILVCIRP